MEHRPHSVQFNQEVPVRAQFPDGLPFVRMGTVDQDERDTDADAGPPTHACQSCGSPQAKAWSTGGAYVRLCPVCAALHDIGCP